MMNKFVNRAWGAAVAAFALASIAPANAHAQSWKTPNGSARAAWVNSGGVTTTVAATTLPSGGGIQSADDSAATVSGLLSTGSATSVTSGSADVSRLGVQGVATAADVNILNGRITASRVIAIATVSDAGNRTSVDGDGSGASSLVIDGVAIGDGLAPNSRVELPGAGYVILNEQLRGKGRGASLTVNMIHVYLTGATTGEIIVASATSASSGS